MNWFLMPGDEAELVSFVNSLGLVPLSMFDSDDDALPTPFGSESSEFVWWAPWIGPIERLGDAPPTADPRDRVMRQINQDVDPDGWTDAIDVGRTPVLRFRRANWNANGCLNPGLLQGMSIRVKDHPPELLALRRRTERWLKSDGEGINPFQHTIETPVREPERLGALAAWARPRALDWIHNGGKVWPWSG